MGLLGSSELTVWCSFGGQLEEHHGTATPSSFLSHLHMGKLRHVGSLSHPIPPHLIPSNPILSHPIPPHDIHMDIQAPIPAWEGLSG